MTCKHRVKPKLLRDIKTEALLVFIRTILEQNFYETENAIGYSFILVSNEDNLFIHDNLKKLLLQLKNTVVSSLYLKTLVENANRNQTVNILAKREAPLMLYYSKLVNTLELCLADGEYWIPELLVISLLSEWLLEEEKTTYFYPYLKEFDYLDLSTRYDNSRKILGKEKKEVIMNMYKISSKLIEQLKKIEYKINNTRKRYHSK
jgi:hypothetical protein